MSVRITGEISPKGFKSLSHIIYQNTVAKVY